MAAYVLVELAINDGEQMGPYMEQVAETVAAFDGRYLVRGGDVEVLEGSTGKHPLKVILEFPALEAARKWHRSDAYQAGLPYRLNNSNANFLLIEGV